jgi:hypothetical protein
MPARIEKAVRKRVPHLSRRTQDVQVVAISEHGASSAEDSIDCSREPRADGFHAACEIARAGRLDDRVQVVVLHRVLNEAEAPTLARRSEAALELTHQAKGPQRRQPAPNLQCDVAGMTTRERRPPMRIARIRTGLAAGARASSTPVGCIAKIEIELSNATCHDPHCDMQM